jgi:WD40 repeat protein
LWDVASETLTGHLDGPGGEVWSLAFSSDSATLAAGTCGLVVDNECREGQILAWKLASGGLRFAPWIGHMREVSAVAFSADGKTMATGSCGKVAGSGACREGEILLWDVASWKPVSPPLRAHRGYVEGLAFGREGQTLLSWGSENQLIAWTVDVDSWKAQACAKANRNLSSEEWGRFLPEESYRKTCANLP